MTEVSFLWPGARNASIRASTALDFVILAAPAAAQKDPDIEALKRQIQALQQQVNHMQRSVDAKIAAVRKEKVVVRKGEEVRSTEAKPEFGNGRSWRRASRSPRTSTAGSPPSRT